MRVELLDLKAEMDRDGVKMIDFLEANLVVDYFNVRVASVFVAEDRHVCRPDLISFDAYGSPNHVDVILKFNQITNPFRVSEGDILMAPVLQSFRTYYRKSPQVMGTAVINTKSLYIDPARASAKDVSRVKQLERIAARTRNGSTEVKPTHLLRAGERPFTLDGDAFTLAPDISRK